MIAFKVFTRQHLPGERLFASLRPVAGGAQPRSLRRPGRWGWAPVFKEDNHGGLRFNREGRDDDGRRPGHATGSRGDLGGLGQPSCGGGAPRRLAPRGGLALLVVVLLGCGGESAATPIATSMSALRTAPPILAPTPRPVSPSAVQPPPAAAPVDPYAALRAQGISAICVDGSYSTSKTRSGTCSHHGGVKAWTGRI